MTILIEESTFDSVKDARKFLLEKGFAKDRIDYLLERVTFGTSLADLKKHAESKGMTALPADDITRKDSQEYFLTICQGWDKLNDPNLSVIKRFSLEWKLSRALKKIKQTQFLHLKPRSQKMLENVRNLNPGITAIGDTHAHYLKKRNLFTKTFFAGSPLGKWQIPYFAFRGKIARFFDERKRRK